MDCQDYITELVERKKGQHLQREERGAIQHLKNAGYTNRAIARAIGCSPTTVGNELKRGTPPRKSSKGRKPGYSARRGEAAYKANRKRSRKPHRICHCTRFIRWIMEQVKEHKWSLDACVGYARVPFPVSWTVKMKKKQKETQDILSYHTQAAGCSDKARAKASGGRQPIEECGRTGL